MSLITDHESSYDYSYSPFSNEIFIKDKGSLTSVAISGKEISLFKRVLYFFTRPEDIKALKVRVFSTNKTKTVHVKLKDLNHAVNKLSSLIHKNGETAAATEDVEKLFDIIKQDPRCSAFAAFLPSLFINQQLVLKDLVSLSENSNYALKLLRESHSYDDSLVGVDLRANFFEGILLHLMDNHPGEFSFLMTNLYRCQKSVDQLQRIIPQKGSCLSDDQMQACYVFSNLITAADSVQSHR